MDLFKELSSLLEDDKITAPEGQNTTSKNFYNEISINKKKIDDDNISTKDAMDLVDKAHEKAEEVDTVAYGLELNDGEIVKVYVNADEAEDFEKAMGELLGQEDDIEVAINKLADDFDIVSVEWPEEREQNNEISTEVGNEEEQPGEAPKEKKVQLSFKLNKDEPDKETDEKGGDEEEQKDDKDSNDDLGFGDDEQKGTDEEEQKDDSIGDFGFGSDEEEAKGEDEEEQAKDEKGKKPKAKKKEKVKESISNFWEDFPVLNEKEIDQEKEEKKIEGFFKTSIQKKIVKLILLLGVPEQRLIQVKPQFRHGVREAALHINNNTKAKNFLNRSIREMEELVDKYELEKKEKELDSVDEAIGASILEIFDNLLELIHSLGVPSGIIHSKKTILKQHMRPMLNIIAKHSKIRGYLGQLGKALGHHHHAKEELEEAVRLGTDVYLKMVSTVASSLGIPDDNLVYKKADLVTSLRAKASQIDIQEVRRKAIPLVKALEVSAVAEGQIFENEYSQREKAENIGSWSFVKGHSLIMKNGSIKIVIQSATELSRFSHGIDDGFEVTVKDKEGKHYNFKPISNGLRYAIYPLDNDQYENGILMDKEDVKSLLDILEN